MGNAGCISSTVVFGEFQLDVLTRSLHGPSVAYLPSALIRSIGDNAGAHQMLSAPILGV